METTDATEPAEPTTVLRIKNLRPLTALEKADLKELLAPGVAAAIAEQRAQLAAGGKAQ